jgi:aldehyde:ferredoxin oxidoreductase
LKPAAYDTLGFCILAGSAIGPNKEVALGLINARLGTGWTWQDVAGLGKSVPACELDFNRRAGFTGVDERLPEFMYGETIPPHNSPWDVPEEEILGMWGPLLNT